MVKLKKSIQAAFKSLNLPKEKIPNLKTLAAAGLATFIILGFIYLNGQIFGGNPINKSLNKTVSAIKSSNPALFEKYVDAKTLSASIVNQVLLPTPTATTNPELGEAAGSLAALIRPTLSASLHEELISAIGEGVFLRPTEEPSNSLLTRLRDNLAGPSIQFKGFGKTEQKGNGATATAKFYRADLKRDFNLAISLKKSDGLWRITDLPNFGPVINSLAKLQADKLEIENAALLQKMANSLKVSDVRKSSTEAKWAVGKGIFLSAAFTNESKKDMVSFTFQVHISDKSGNHLKTFSIKENDDLAENMTLEKSWPISLNPLLPNDNKIFDLPAEDLSISIAPQSIQFNDGSQINLLKSNEK